MSIVSDELVSSASAWVRSFTFVFFKPGADFDKTVVGAVKPAVQTGVEAMQDLEGAM
jgi:hypothetical protein